MQNNEIKYKLKKCYAYNASTSSFYIIHFIFKELKTYYDECSITVHLSCGQAMNRAESYHSQTYTFIYIGSTYFLYI